MLNMNTFSSIRFTSKKMMRLKNQIKMIRLGIDSHYDTTARIAARSCKLIIFEVSLAGSYDT